LIKFDVIRAKALFGKDLGAICPTVVSTEKLHIHGGKHPLLLLHFRNRDEEVVSFDLHLHNNNKILIVSGPNAGGKTILMKSVGLLQLMVQSGIPVPVDENSEFGTFSQFFVDIGDQQSIEDDLSTYSSHLKNMKSFLDHATDKSLILIDELGSGTDPRIGGAIAEAILHKLRQQGVHAVITTHYSNLKNYAHRQKGVVNAAMSFDQKDLRPTYELLIGKPGSSFAFELAQKSQLPAQVIANAKKNAGNALVNIDKMLSDIQSQRKSLQKRLNELEKRESRIDHLRKTYERMRKDLEGQRKKIKMMAKEYDISKGVAIDKAMKETIEEIKASKDLEKAKKLAREEKEKQQRRAADLSKMEEEDWKERQADRDKKIEVGDYVKIRKTGTIGQVERIEKGKAYIRTGNFQLEAKLKDLVPSRAPMDVNKQKSVRVHADPTKSKTMRSKLDIRGMPRAEANKILEKYFDQALMQGMHRLEIIHGKGSGVLKQLVREKANKLSAIESVEHPPDEAGGEGVSIVKI
jgi:DNA mismatch repair protein MutS2